MNNFCSNCGKKLESGQTICPNCGAFVQKQVVQNKNVDDKNADTGLILGLISIMAWILPLAGYPVTICGIVFSSKGLKSQISKGKAIAGLILSIIFLIVTLTNSALGVMMWLSQA